jgi:hypothetical protein
MSADVASLEVPVIAPGEAARQLGIPTSRSSTGLRGTTSGRDTDMFGLAHVRARLDVTFLGDDGTRHPAGRFRCVPSCRRALVASPCRHGAGVGRVAVWSWCRWFPKLQGEDARSLLRLGRFRAVWSLFSV